MVEGWAVTNGSSVRVIEQPKLTWRIRRGVFIYLPEIDYDSIERCVRVAGVGPFLTILTPPRREILMQKVFAALLGDRAPIVTPADTYLSLRNVFAQADFQRSRDQAVVDLLNRYNERIAAARLDELLVEVPLTGA